MSASFNMNVSAEATARQISECFIKPKQQVEEHRKPVYLNTWDLAMLSIRYIRKGLLWYKAPSGILNLDKLKDALSIALVHFHPLAGQLETIRLSSNKGSLVFIDPMKGPGAKFIHATVDLSISSLLSSSIDIPHAVHLFFDDNREAVNYDGHFLPLLTVQVTELLDGVFIGCSMNHVCGDGSSFWRFINSWSEIFMNKMTLNNHHPSTLPIHTRWFMDGFEPIIELPFSHPDEFIHRSDPANSPQLRERIFRFSIESIRKIKARANSTITSSDYKISSFQSLSALILRCVTRARRISANEQTTCHIAVNNKTKIDPPLSGNYFGNCVQGVKATTTAGELLQQSLGWVAMRLNQAISAHSDKEVRESVAVWLRTPNFYEPRSLPLGGFDVYMVGSARFNVYGNEFGFGKPVAALKDYGSKDGNVFSNPGREGAGSVELQTCFLYNTMRALEMDEEFMGLVS